LEAEWGWEYEWVIVGQCISVVGSEPHAVLSGRLWRQGCGNSEAGRFPDRAR
jgi:hypothetical protein